MNPEKSSLSFKTKLGFGLGNIGVMIGKQAPKALSLPIYNIALGVSPAWVGTVMALSRVWDAVTDPLVGHWSDRVTTRWGRRKPFIFAGSILAGLFFASIWWFPRGLTDVQYLLYYIATSLLFYLALTVFSVPWYAMGYELSEDYDERTRLQGFASFLGPAGQVLVAWKPLPARSRAKSSFLSVKPLPARSRAKSSFLSVMTPIWSRRGGNSRKRTTRSGWRPCCDWDTTRSSRKASPTTAGPTR